MHLGSLFKKSLRIQICEPKFSKFKLTHKESRNIWMPWWQTESRLYWSRMPQKKFLEFNVENMALENSRRSSLLHLPCPVPETEWKIEFSTSQLFPQHWGVDGQLLLGAKGESSRLKGGEVVFFSKRQLCQKSMVALLQYLRSSIHQYFAHKSEQLAIVLYILTWLKEVGREI